LVAGEAELKAKLRHCHARIVMNSEEIAFYGGDGIEKKALETAYRNETRQSLRIHFAKLWFVVIEQFFMKYVWAGSGMVLVAIPILTAKSFGEKSGEANRTEYYMTTKNLLIAGGDAVEKLMTSYKEVAELAGYASRVEKVLTVFDEVSQGTYIRESVARENLIFGKPQSRDSHPEASFLRINAEN
jgi:ATP-binding cassette subfamily D (ALD) protein 2